MCGITGAVFKKGDHVTRELISSMNSAIAHRGPDAEGIYVHENIGLGHRRLSIIDTSDAGNQPFFSHDQNIVVVFNGEIYNYLELKEELKGSFEFKTQTDTEVIIAAYKKWDINCIERFNGMFAFALFDKQTDRFILVRDRLGIKPLYIAEKNGTILYASELRAILKSGLIERKLNIEALADYLRYQTVHAPNTIVESVKMLMPGHYLIWQNNQFHIKCYWKPSDHSGGQAGINKTEARRTVRDLLQNSVEIQMRADVPFGAFLSGGIDSSIIVGLMAEQSTLPVETFSVTFHEKEFDESPYSNLIAKRFNTKHHPIQLSSRDFMHKVPEALSAMDHPSGDGPNTFVVSEVTRKAGIKMALSGLGGDELFAGYDVFKRLYSLEQKKWLNATPRIIRSLAGSTLQKIKPSVAADKLKEFLSADEVEMPLAYKLSRQVWMDNSIGKLLKANEQKENFVEKIFKATSSLNGGVISKVSIAEIETYMQNVLLRDTDQMSMKHALEIRVPFLDHRLVEFVLGLDDLVKFPNEPKQLLVESMYGIIPSEVVNRPKMGFTFPWAYWMKTDLLSFCEEGLDHLKGLRAIDETFLMEVWNKFLNNDSTFTWSRLWPLVVLGHWIKENDIHE